MAERPKKRSACWRYRAILKPTSGPWNAPARTSFEVRSAADLGRRGRPGHPRRRKHHHVEAAGTRKPDRSAAGIRNRAPIFGTCAGAILLASDVTNPSQKSLGLMDISVERNGYGRQLDSRIARVQAEGQGNDFEAVFIRAPIIRRVGSGAKILASYQGDPVLVEQGRHLAATFHPELTEDTRVHLMFLEKVP